MTSPPTESPLLGDETRRLRNPLLPAQTLRQREPTQLTDVKKEKQNKLCMTATPLHTASKVGPWVKTRPRVPIFSRQDIASLGRLVGIPHFSDDIRITPEKCPPLPSSTPKNLLS